MTWQTGYPLAVRYQSGAPVYTPTRRPLADAGRPSAILVAGAVDAVAPWLEASAANASVIAIGPRASASAVPLQVAVDTGIAGIQEGGTAYRMDDVPLPLRPPLPGARSAADTLSSLLAAVHARLPGRAR
jgi:formylmethanofuran dehydrogenase subunit B